MIINPQESLFSGRNSDSTPEESGIYPPPSESSKNLKEVGIFKEKAAKRG